MAGFVFGFETECGSGVDEIAHPAFALRQIVFLVTAEGGIYGPDLADFDFRS